jgi:hypothetical protein
LEGNSTVIDFSDDYTLFVVDQTTMQTFLALAVLAFAAGTITGHQITECTSPLPTFFTASRCIQQAK